MFRIIHLSVRQWHEFRHVRLPFTKLVALLSGPNGTGKTTLIDALRVCLGLSVSAGRSLRGYLRAQGGPALICLVLSNPLDPARSRRVWQPANPACTGAEVTLACWVRNTGGGTPERRFLVLPGRPDATTLQNLFQAKQGLEVGELHAAQKAMGIDTSALDKLIIEQGRIGEVSAMKPRDRYKLVESQLMDPMTIKRFNDGLAKLHAAENDEHRQRTQLARVDAELIELENLSRRRKEYDELQRQRDTATAMTWIGRLQIATKLEGDATLQIATLDLERAEAQAALDAAERALRDLQLAKESDHADANAEAATLTGLEAEEKRLIREESDHERSLREIAAAEVRLLSLPVVEPAYAEASAKEARDTLLAAEVARREATARVEGLNKEIAALRRNEPPFHPNAQPTWAALRKEGVEFAIVKDLVDPARSSPHLEAALGDLRYALVVANDAHAKAVRIAQANNYPGPVYTGPRAAGKLHGAVIDKRAPGWLMERLREVEISESGWRDRHGEWRNQVDPILHGADLEKLLAARVADLAEAKVALARAETRVELDRTASSTAETRLSESRERALLLVQVSSRTTVDRALAAVKRSLAELTPRLEQQRKLVYGRAALAEQHESATRARTGDRRAARARLQEIDGNLLAARNDAHSGKTNAEEARSHLTPGHQDRALGEPVSAAEWESKLSVALNGLGSFDMATLPGDDIYLRVERMAATHKDAKASLERVIEAREEYRVETEQSRRAYMSRANASLDRFEKRVRELGKFVDMEVDMELPRFTEESTNEDLENAEIHVSFRFGDEEAFRKSGDRSFSGGQRVLQGLVLLMALSDMHTESFFIVDEPYAHLSIDRIDQVATFLATSGPQFIITAPTTLSKEIFGTSTQVVTMLPKPKGEKLQPHPALGSEDILHA